MKKSKESRIARTPAWVLALFIGILSIISAFVFEHVTIPGNSTLGIIGLIFYVVLIPVASFFISRAHPKSRWYTPFICNPVSVLGTIFHPLAWTTLSEYLLWVCSLGLTVLAALIGASIGKRRTNQADMDKHEKINYVEFPARDLETSKAFFSKAFGWSFEDYGPEYTSFNNSGIAGGFYKSALSARTENGSALIVLYSKHLENTLKKVVAAGGVIVKDIFSFPGGRRFHFSEPSGNEFAVWSE